MASKGGALFPVGSNPVVLVSRGKAKNTVGCPSPSRSEGVLAISPIPSEAGLGEGKANALTATETFASTTLSGSLYCLWIRTTHSMWPDVEEVETRRNFGIVQKGSFHPSTTKKRFMSSANALECLGSGAWSEKPTNRQGRSLPVSFKRSSVGRSKNTAQTQALAVSSHLLTTGKGSEVHGGDRCSPSHLQLKRQPGFHYSLSQQLDHHVLTPNSVCFQLRRQPRRNPSV